MRDGKALAYLRETMETSCRRARATGDTSLFDWSRKLDEALTRLVETTQQLWAAGDPSLTLANASMYLEAFGHVVVAWIWLEQAMVARAGLAAATGGESDAFYHGKWSAATYFFRWELPTVDTKFDLLASLDATTLDMEDGWF